MSGRKLANGIYNVDTDWKDETESKDILKYGLDNIDFSQMDTTTIPQILAGSSVDVDGVVYRFDSDEAITGAPLDGTIYIIITGGATAIASFTNVALPSYNFSKQGYYGVGGERYLLKVLKSGVSYTNKVQLSKNYFGRTTEFSGNITQLAGLASLKALTVSGDITQTEGVTNLKDTTVNGNLSATTLLTAVHDFPGNSGNQWRIIESAGSLTFRRLGNTLRAFGFSEGGRTLLGNSYTDNGMDALQVTGSIYASSEIRSLTKVLTGFNGSGSGLGTLDQTAIELGQTRLTDGTVLIDMTSSGTDSGQLYTDFGLRFIRTPGDAGIASIVHRGVGNFNIQMSENADILLHTYATFSNIAIELKKNTAITGFLNTSSYGLFGGALFDALYMLNVNGAGKFAGALESTSLLTGSLVSNNINTGQGVTEVYPMNQPVRTTDNILFDTITYTGVLQGKYSVGNIFQGTEDKYFDAFELWGLSPSEYTGGFGTFTKGTSKGYVVGVEKSSPTAYTVTYISLSGITNTINIEQNDLTTMNMSFNGDLALL